MGDVVAGIDIGGTKCAVTLADFDEDKPEIIARRQFPTPDTPEAALKAISERLAALLEASGGTLQRIGVSCGGPLDSQRGVILSPPNLPGWDEIPVVDYFAQQFGVPAALQNDANAGALAEWMWGAGRGFVNLIFLTFGTGMGAGLILNGRLYSGTNDLAGEVGHIRLAEDGPVGYGKAGSFEGFCSGGGIARLAKSRAAELLDAGTPPAYCPTRDALDQITAESVAQAANDGDVAALEIFDTVARRLGQGLSVLIDILNPQRIIVGSIYLRQRPLLEAAMHAAIQNEALALAASVCDVVPPGLGESVGDYAAAAVARYSIE